MAATAPVLPPGFRFHPTDHELVNYYLRGKIQGLQMQLVIPEIELCKVDPSELPGKSFLAGRCDHQEWYFYSQRFPRYGKTGTRINRSTPSGYWKSTGKDRSVHGEHATIGYKKTLVYLHGRAHHGQRTDWAMHEYRLDDTQDAYALYRLYKKKGTNPSPDVPSGGLDKRKRTTSSPDELGTAAADEEDASRKVVPAVTAVGAEGAPMQFAASGGAVGAEGATMHFAASAGAGAPMHFAANGGAVGAEGAPMHFAPSGGAGGA
ncbi:NAC domain-containing protein 45-like isoform X2 [Triticum aestivum]|uniref:NAC domain-containing protein 45-like isoform X2 n=1 Tax=Triticum aestivum TaxID=4565 RepID=UPI001D007AAE|nr:NAC domain-containing protein 45-like isoform X2 [Triticum aestivum]